MVNTKLMRKMTVTSCVLSDPEELRFTLENEASAIRFHRTRSYQNAGQATARFFSIINVQLFPSNFIAHTDLFSRPNIYAQLQQILPG